MKLKKKSGLIGAVIALSCASLVSVGFASWVISQGDTEYATGTILVDNVTEKNYEIHLGSGVTGNAIDDQIVFGWDAFDTTLGLTNHQWLSNNDKLNGAAGTSSAEHLTVSFDFTIDNITGAINAETGPVKSVSGNTAVLENNYNLTAVLAVETGTYNTTVGGVDNVLGALPVAPALSYSAGTFTCTIQFAWGSHFTAGGQIVNPMTYYNSLEGTTANKEEASTVLTALAAMEVTYKVTLTVAQ